MTKRYLAFKFKVHLLAKHFDLEIKILARCQRALMQLNILFSKTYLFTLWGTSWPSIKFFHLEMLQHSLTLSPLIRQYQAENNTPSPSHTLSVSICWHMVLGRWPFHPAWLCRHEFDNNKKKSTAHLRFNQTWITWWRETCNCMEHVHYWSSNWTSNITF